MSVTVLGLGEVVWDLLPTGPQIGGAPANFAYHAHALGANASVITRVGNDPLGQKVLQQFDALGLPLDTVQMDDVYPTGAVSVTLNQDGVPHFTIQERAAWDRLEVSMLALQLAQQADVICFGTVAQRHRIARAAIHTLVTATRATALRIFDINLRQDLFTRPMIEVSLHMANVLKLNDDELLVLREMFVLPGTVEQQITQLAEHFRLHTVALTLGARGSLLYREGQWSQETVYPIDVADTVGAGDAFTAALALGLLSMTDLNEIHANAAQLARYVCRQRGAMPAVPDEIRGKFTLNSSIQKADDA